jgi:hypothetical protein
MPASGLLFHAGLLAPRHRTHCRSSGQSPVAFIIVSDSPAPNNPPEHRAVFDSRGPSHYRVTHPPLKSIGGQIDGHPSPPFAVQMRERW